MKIFLLLLSLTVCGFAATKYVDSGASGSGTGADWTNAYTTLASVSASPGDTVYISGGPSGSTRTYAVPASPGYWNAPSGNSGAWITYQIGQDSAHNGTAIFTASTYQLLSGPSYFTFSGKVGDGSDGLMHFQLSGFATKEVISNVNHFHFEYVDSTSSGVAAIGSIGGGSLNNVEINNCYMKMVDLAGDHLLYSAFAGSAVTDNKIHHNTFLFPHVGPGTGADGIQGSGTGYSIYNNTFRGYNATYTAGQHQDGFQATSGSNIAIYNNEFVDCSNYAVYGDAYYGPFTDLYIYNNVARYEDSAMIVNTPTPTPGGFIVGVDGQWNTQNPGVTCVFTRVWLLNNTVVDYGANGGVAISNVRPDLNTASFVSCRIQNNLLINTPGGVRNENNTTTTISNNVEISAANAATHLTSYSTYSASNSLHLTAAATTAIHAGVNLQATLAFADRDGVAYANPPSVGAYEYASGGSTPITYTALTATNLSIP